MQVTVNQNQMTWIPTSKAFVTDSSDLGLKFWPSKIVLVGKTGKSVEYIYSKRNTDGEGEVLDYEYLPNTISKSKVPSCIGTKVVLIND